MIDISKFFTVKEAAKRLGVTEDWVREALCAKKNIFEKLQRCF